MRTLLLVCLAAVLWWENDAWAANYLVSGAGTAEVNGVYVENGTNCGKPMYEYNNGSTTYYLFYTDDMDYGWAINTDVWIGMLDDSYYYNYDDASDTPPTTGWDVGWDGDFPAPTIGDAGPALSYSRTIFKESAYNDGSIDNDPVMEITHNGYNGDYFLGTVGEDFVASGKVVVSNLPDGLTAEILFVDSLTLTARLRSIASAHTNADDTTLVIAFGDSAFNTYDASGVYNSTSSTVTVDFIQEYSVGTGGDFTTITSAISGADDGDILNLAAETFTEEGITVNKDLVIKGQGAENTIVQANAVKYTATNRVFLISTENTVTLQDMSVRNGNVASRGAGIYNYGTLILERCAVYDNRGTASQTYGAGIYSSGDLTVLSSVIYNNSLTGTIQYNAGGGICIGYGTVLIDNSTITGNSVMAEGNGNSVGGGGIYFSGTDGTIRNSTICGNTSLVKGGGISVQTSRTLYLENTIVADNSSGSGPDVYTYTSGVISSRDYNLIEDVSGATITGTTTNNVTGSDPMLSALADNGGPTYTCALQSGSPAINAGNPSAPGGDQRYYSRNGIPDIGAFEYTGTANTPPTVTSVTVDTTDENEAYSYTGTATDAESTPTISFAHLPSWLTAAGASVSGTPPVGAADTSFIVIADDGDLADSITVTLYVFGTGSANQAPVITTADPDTLTRANEAYSQQVAATDADGDSVIYSLLTAPSGMAISGSGLITWTPDTSHVGANAVAVQASDGNGGYDTLSYSITVLDPVYAEETVADTGTYLFCDIGVTLHVLSLTGTGTITARVYPDSFPPNLPGSNPVKRFFAITKDSSITAITAEVTFTYNQTEFAASDISDETTLYGARYTGSEWMPYGSVTDTANNTVTLTTTEFSVWSIGGDGGALPVTLSSFEARQEGAGVVLAWTTESEADNLGFNVWRSADVSGDFVKVNGVLIAGAGDFTGRSDYSYDDIPPSSGTWHYRLEQVDYQGRETFVAAVSVEAVTGIRVPVTANGRPAVRIPNPARTPSVTIIAQGGEAISIGLYDIRGKYVGNLFTGTLPAGEYTCTGPDAMEPGIYYVQINGNGWHLKRMLIITK